MSQRPFLLAAFGLFDASLRTSVKSTYTYTAVNYSANPPNSVTLPSTPIRKRFQASP